MDISVTFFFCLLKNSWQGKDKYQRKSPALSDITGVAESKYRKHPRPASSSTFASHHNT